MTKQKLTREEKREQERAAARTARLAAYRASFLKNQSRQVYSEQAAVAAQGNGDNTGMALYGLLYQYRSTETDLRRKIDSAQRSLAEAIARLDEGERPSWHSNGILGSTSLDLDQATFTLAALREALARMAWATNWRVREIETVAGRKHNDTCAAMTVAQETDGKWRIKVGSDYATAPGENEQLPGYDTEDAAWQSLHVLVEHRTID